MEIKFKPMKMSLIDVSYSYKKNNTKFLIFVSLTDFKDSFLCFLIILKNGRTWLLHFNFTSKNCFYHLKTTVAK